MRLDVQLLPQPGASDVAVVIDVLRMTTTASLLLDRGLDRLFVVAEVDDARVLAKAEGALLLGERENRPLPGFDGGNSPLEYLNRELAGKTAVLSTSNGSRAVGLAADAEHLLLGAIVNAAAVAKRALGLAHRKITLVCAGTAGLPSLDDAVAAACIARELSALEPSLAPSDSAKLCLRALQASPDLFESLRTSAHGRALEGDGYGEDLRFAAKLNLLTAVPKRLGPALFGRA
jgi:2-phosphosulfolactate phosphatase